MFFLLRAANSYCSAWFCICLYVCLCVFVYVHRWASILWDQKRVLGPCSWSCRLLLVVLLWMLGAKCTLNHWGIIPPAPPLPLLSLRFRPSSSEVMHQFPSLCASSLCLPPVCPAHGNVNTLLKLWEHTSPFFNIAAVFSALTEEEWRVPAAYQVFSDRRSCTCVCSKYRAEGGGAQGGHLLSWVTFLLAVFPRTIPTHIGQTLSMWTFVRKT